MERHTLARILVVDDEVKLSSALCEALTGQGYEATGFTSAGDALGLLKKECFDLLLTDLVMPDMDGIELLKCALRIDPHLVGIVMTGQGTVQTAVEAMKVGAFDYVLKPFKLDRLLPVLARAMEMHRLRLDNMQLRETLAIYELCQTISHTLDMDTLLNKTADAALQQLDADEVSIMLPTQEGNELYVAVVRGESRGTTPGSRVPLTEDEAGWVARHKGPLSPQGEATDMHCMPPYVLTDLGRSLSMPMLVGGKLLGVLNVSTDRTQPFALGQVKGLSILANTAAAALESVFLYRQVRQAEEQYRSIFENTVEGIYQTSPEGRFISVNPALARMLGYDSPEELQNAVTDLSRQLYVHPQRRSEFLRLIEKRGAVKDFEVQFRRKDNRVTWVELNVHAVRDKKGKLAYLEGIAHDITERRALESQLRQAQKLEAIGTLAGGIAHDFNNILGIIMGYAEIALMDLSKDLPGKAAVEEVLKAVDRAKDLVKQILTFSRKGEQERKPLQIIPVVNEALKLLRASLPTSIEIRKKIDLAHSQNLVLADPTQIHQVLMNLSTNAAHAMREHGGILEVELAAVELSPLDVGKLPELGPGKYVRLTVQDTGDGMDRTILDRIFDPYFTTKGPGEGTGLGLAVVHGIVKSHNGAITVRSEPGEGTRFDVYLPRLDGQVSSQREASAEIPTGTESVLLIDDEEQLLDAVKCMLGHLGYKVTATTSSVEALLLFRQQPEAYDLLITDYTMPKMTGADLAKEVMAIRPDVPIILCTGFSQRIDEESAGEMRISGFIMKPVDIRCLAVLIRKVLRKE